MDFLKKFHISGELNTKGQGKPTTILLMAATLPALQRTFGSIEFARATFQNSSEFFCVMYMFITAFVFFGIIPALTIKFFFSEPLKEYGIRLGDWRWGLPAVLIFFILISVILIYPSSQTAEIRSFFPYDKSAGETIFSFIRLQFFRGLLFYSAWEFFFRGFILFGLRKYFGDWMAICIQVIPSCLWHLGLSAGEIFISIAAGLLFGVMAIRTRSIFWPFLLHYFIGIILDLFIIFTG